MRRQPGRSHPAGHPHPCSSTRNRQHPTSTPMVKRLPGFGPTATKVKQCREMPAPSEPIGTKRRRSTEHHPAWPRYSPFLACDLCSGPDAGSQILLPWVLQRRQLHEGRFTVLVGNYVDRVRLAAQGRPRSRSGTTTSDRRGGRARPVKPVGLGRPCFLRGQLDSAGRACSKAG